MPLQFSKALIINTKKRELQCPHSDLKVLRKPFSTNIVIAAHAKRENHYANSVLNLTISQVPKSQESITLLFKNIFHE